MGGFLRSRAFVRSSGGFWADSNGSDSAYHHVDAYLAETRAVARTMGPAALLLLGYRARAGVGVVAARVSSSEQRFGVE